MSEKQPSKKVDVLRMVEDRLEEFSNRITEMESKISEIDEKAKKSFLNFQNYVNLLNNLIYADILMQSEVERLRSWRAGDTGYFDSYMEQLQNKYDILEQMRQLGLQAGTLVISNQIAQLMELSIRWSLPFDKFGSYLISKLGKDIAREIVDKSDLMEYYGKDVIPIWDSLMGK